MAVLKVVERMHLWGRRFRLPTALSPFRPDHKRKNWFVGVEVLEPPPDARFDARDVRFETHVPTGLQASASESQHSNKKLARLSPKLEEQRGEAGRGRWQAHRAPQRRNPVHVFNFKED
jgi:peptide chain release factor